MSSEKKKSKLKSFFRSIKKRYKIYKMLQNFIEIIMKVLYLYLAK